jgi:hypothetical protein
MSASRKFRAFGQIEFAVKVMSAFSAVIPFLGAVVSLKESLENERFKLLLTNRALFIANLFGIAYAACGDVSATAVAVVLVVYLMSLGHEEAMHGSLTFGYDALLDKDAEEAARELKSIVPASNPVVVTSFDAQTRAGRVQLLANEQGKVVAYRRG